MGRVEDFGSVIDGVPAWVAAMSVVSGGGWHAEHGSGRGLCLRAVGKHVGAVDVLVDGAEQGQGADVWVGDVGAKGCGESLGVKDLKWSRTRRVATTARRPRRTAVAAGSPTSNDEPQKDCPKRT
jgi:hypothetical protein